MWSQGAVTIASKLDCGLASKFSKKLDAIMQSHLPTAECTLYAGFRPVTPAWSCWPYSFPDGTLTVGGGSGEVRAGDTPPSSVSAWGSAATPLSASSLRRGLPVARPVHQVDPGGLPRPGLRQGLRGRTDDLQVLLPGAGSGHLLRALKGNGILPDRDGGGCQESGGRMRNVVDTGYGTYFQRAPRRAQLRWAGARPAH